MRLAVEDGLVASLCRALPLRRGGSGCLFRGTRKDAPMHDCRCQNSCGQQHTDLDCYFRFGTNDIDCMGLLNCEV